jgi:preprotein translocase subunit SecY
MARQQGGQSLSQGGLKELKSRLLFLLFAISVFRFGAYVPVPGLNPEKLAVLFQHENSTIIGLFNMFSGGALRRFSLFALGIMPYISASIIVQLLSAMLPSLEQLKKEGESGQRKINQYTRYGTLGLALFQSLGVSRMLGAQGVALYSGPSFYLVAVITLTTGTMFLMWLGEQITERGVGNGISMIIFAGIASGIPEAVGRTLEQVRQNEMQMIVLFMIIFAVALITSFVVFVERGLRKITVNYAKRQQGNKLYAAQSSSLPLKINMAGVIPPIFASSIILFPGTLAMWFGTAHGFTWLNTLAFLLQPGQWLYVVLFASAIVFFCFFYTAIVFNPKDTADNLKRSGAFVPGIRPGEQTAKYIDTVMTRLTMVGAIYIAMVSLLPEFFIVTWNVPFFFGGTSLLIVVVVVMDFMSQVQAHMMSTHYDKMMKKVNTKGDRFTLLR